MKPNYSPVELDYFLRKIALYERVLSDVNSSWKSKQSARFALAQLDALVGLGHLNDCQNICDQLGVKASFL
ncbi:MAG: hypothetical protein AAF798_19420 [Bacteroidota bacterium]